MCVCICGIVAVCRVKQAHLCDVYFRSIQQMTSQAQLDIDTLDEAAAKAREMEIMSKLAQERDRRAAANMAIQARFLQLLELAPPTIFAGMIVTIVDNSPKTCNPDGSFDVVRKLSGEVLQVTAATVVVNAGPLGRKELGLEDYILPTDVLPPDGKPYGCFFRVRQCTLLPSEIAHSLFKKTPQQAAFAVSLRDYKKQNDTAFSQVFGTFFVSLFLSNLSLSLSLSQQHSRPCRCKTAGGCVYACDRTAAFGSKANQDA